MPARPPGPLGSRLVELANASITADFAAGRLSYAKVRTLTRVATPNNRMIGNPHDKSARVEPFVATA